MPGPWSRTATRPRSLTSNGWSVWSNLSALSSRLRTTRSSSRRRRRRSAWHHRSTSMVRPVRSDGRGPPPLDDASRATSTPSTASRPAARWPAPRAATTRSPSSPRRLAGVDAPRHAVPLVGGPGRRAAEQLGAGAQAGQRRAQLVAGVLHEPLLLAPGVGQRSQHRVEGLGQPPDLVAHPAPGSPSTGPESRRPPRPRRPAPAPAGQSRGDEPADPAASAAPARVMRTIRPPRADSTSFVSVRSRAICKAPPSSRCTVRTRYSTPSTLSPCAARCALAVPAATPVLVVDRQVDARPSAGAPRPRPGPG